MTVAGEWIEKITGPFEDKKRYREYKARTKLLPESHRTAVEALDRYLMYFGSIGKSDVLLRMVDDLIDLFERAAADGTPVRDVVGEDPVEFAEEFLANYADGMWINKERDRLRRAVERAAGEESEKEGESPR
ncbi:DNA-binding ferritin-like protein (Dps family) [Nocardiopsis flavescens]|uniref:DNA-binding ferritin-like protein (Dps family) n=1 Tax=Nocardiopsis flavescens TaxID=758803 RepID=A0A1M6L4G0_9ACTN|nr:DUF1048 domain-containing protein [Nocardiopsis flavescens]SHJ66072.1 DNA-binding ferritin-like protein (Dps family) [Nocardiopsis flavescens]